MKARTTTIFIVILMCIGQYTKAQNCTAGFNYTLDSAHQIVDFHDTSVVSGHVITYSWDFGDGYTSPHQNSSHSYSHPGPYYVCLTVTVDTPQCTNTVCDSITIPASPAHCDANFSYHPSVVHSNTINFIDHSTSSRMITSWSWNFGDGNNSNQQSPSHQYADTGTYYVCLIISDANGLCTDTFCQNVIVAAHSSTCTAVFSTIVDSMGNVNFINTSTGTGVHANYHWTFGDGHGSSMENPHHTYFHPGTYYVCLSISDSSCNNTYCDSITIAPPVIHACNAEFQFQQTNHSVNFHDMSSGSFLNYVWDFGDGHGATTANPSHQYADTGQYTICLYIGDANCSDSICHTIYVHQVNHCQASFTLSADTTTGGFNFTNTSSITATDFLWTFGDGDSSTLQDPSHLYSSSGHYTVCLFIHDSISGCSAHSCYVFHSHHPPHHMALSFALFPDELTSTGFNEVYNDFGLRNYPNPFSNSTIIEYNLVNGAKVDIQLYSLIGKLVMSLPAKKEQPGLHHQEINVNQLGSGIYLLKVSIDGQSSVIKVTVMK